MDCQLLISVALQHLLSASEGAYSNLSTSDCRCSSCCYASKQAASQLAGEALKSPGGTKLSLSPQSRAPYISPPFCFSTLLFPAASLLSMHKSKKHPKKTYITHQTYTEASQIHNTRNQFSLWKQPIKRRQGGLKHLFKTYHYSM